MRSITRLSLLWLGLITVVVRADGYVLPSPADWSGVGRLSRDAGTPILVLFTSDACGYCEKLKQAVVVPMLARGELRGKALMHEIDINSGGKITDFDGERIRTRIFVRRYDVFATPTLAILDDQGHELLPPLVGFDQADSYKKRLERLLERARTVLTSLKAPALTSPRAGKLTWPNL